MAANVKTPNFSVKEREYCADLKSEKDRKVNI